MLKKITIKGKDYTPENWIQIYIDSRSSASFTDIVKEVKDEFKGTKEETEMLVNDYLKIK